MKTGKDYTVDSRNAVIYEGIMEQATQSQTNGNSISTQEAAPITATKIYMNL